VQARLLETVRSARSNLTHAQTSFLTIRGVRTMMIGDDNHPIPVIAQLLIDKTIMLPLCLETDETADH